MIRDINFSIDAVGKCSHSSKPYPVEPEFYRYKQNASAKGRLSAERRLISSIGKKFCSPSTSISIPGIEVA